MKRSDDSTRKRFRRESKDRSNGFFENEIKKLNTVKAEIQKHIECLWVLCPEPELSSPWGRHRNNFSIESGNRKRMVGIYSYDYINSGIASDIAVLFNF